MKKEIKVKENFYEDLLKTVPLESRFRILNEMFLIDFLTIIGFRNGMWKPEEEKLLNKLFKHAKKLSKAQMEEFETWEKDGRPQKQK